MAVNTIVSSAYDTSGNGGRKMVKLSNGWLVSGASDNTGYFRLYVSKDNGQTWNTLTDIVTTGTNASYALASSGTTVYLLYATQAAGATSNNFYSFDATTVTNTGQPIKSNPDTGQTSFGSGVSLTIDSTGTLHAAWCSKNSTYPNSFNIRYSKSTDGGTTWATPTQVTSTNSNGTDQISPCIVIYSNNPVIFSAVGSGILGLKFNGTSWSILQVINTNGLGFTTTGNVQYSPCAVVDSTGTLHVVWHGADNVDNVDANIRYSKSTDGGITWIPMVKLTNGNSYPQISATITLDAEDRLYVYFNGTDSSVNSYTQLRRIISEPQGASWGAIKTLTSATNGQQYPQTPWQITYTPDRFVRYMWQDLQTSSVKYSMDNNVQIAAWSAYDTSGNGGRKLVKLSNGWLVAGTNDGGVNTFHWYVSKDNGVTWVQLCTTTSFWASSGAALASNGTTVYTLIVTSTATANGFFAFDATTVGSTVTTYRNIDSNQTSFGYGTSLTIDSAGTLHAAWCSKNSTYPNAFNVRYSKSTDGGSTWMTPVYGRGDYPQSNSTAYSKNPCIITLPNNSPVLVYEDYSGTNNNYTIASATWNGTKWAMSATFYSGGLSYPQSNPCAVVDGLGNIHVVWQGADATYPSVPNIKYSKSTDGGQTWSTMVNLTTGNSCGLSTPSIVADGNNNLHVLCYGVDSVITTSYAQIRRLTFIGNTWSPIVSLTSNGSGAANYPQALYANNAVSYIWQDQQNNQIRFNSYSTNSVALAGLDTSGNGGRKVVKLSNGWIVAAGIDAVGHYWVFSVSKDNGNTWSQLYANAYSASITTQSLAIASIGTTIYALISFYNGASGNAAIYKLDAIDGTWTALTGPESAQTNVGSGCSLVIDGTGALHAAWCSKNSTYSACFNIRYSKSTDGGNTWQAVTQVTANAGTGNDFVNPCIVVRSNNLPSILAQYTYSTSPNNMSINVENFNGTSWNNVVVYNGTTYGQYNPCAAIDSSDNIHVVWSGTDSTVQGPLNIRYSKSLDGGNTWSAVTNLSKTTGGGGNNYPTITVDASNNLYVYWYGVDAFTSSDYSNIRTVKYSGGSWGALSTVSNNVFAAALNPQVGWQKFNGWNDAIRVIWRDSQSQVNSYSFVILNTSPNAPTYGNVSSNGGSYNKRPKIFVNVSDPDTGNTLTNVEIQISTDNTFATTNLDVQYASDAGYGTTAVGWSGLPTSTNVTTMIDWLPQTDLPVGTLCARVRTKDNDGAWSPWSSTQQFSIIDVPWSDTPSGYGMKAQWMNDLATAINNVRQFRGLETFPFTDDTIIPQDANGNGTDIKTLHITERRTKITDVYTTIGATEPVWGNVTIDNTKDRSGQDIIDLRNAVTAG